MAITVECSISKCRFKSSDGVCRNPKAIAEFSEDSTSDIKVAGCSCAACTTDCGTMPNN